MGKLFEGFKLLCSDFDIILEKGGKLFKGGYYSRVDIMVCFLKLQLTPEAVRTGLALSFGIKVFL